MGLARAGHVVHATVRDHAHDPQLSAGVADRLTIRGLDVLDRQGVTAVVEAIVHRDHRLDVLVNNAGCGLIGGVEQVNLERAGEL